jgi:hypothetical protein
MKQMELLREKDTDEYLRLHGKVVKINKQLDIIIFKKNHQNNSYFLRDVVL